MTSAEQQLKDFRNVVYVVWKHVLDKDPTPVQYDIANWMQLGPRRQGTEAFRGVGKSWIASAFCAFSLRENPNLNILVVSASKDRADAFTTFTLRILREIPIFQHLYPREGQRCRMDGFDVGPAPAAQAPSVKSIGIEGQMTGSRADIIIADDVEVWKNSCTQLMRDKLQERVKEFESILKPGGRIIYLGTPQTEQSIYNKLSDEDRGYQFRIWPVRYPTEEQLVSYGSKLAPMIREKLDAEPKLAGTPTDPQRFNEFDLLEREAGKGPSAFALQFMLDTRLSDSNRYPLKLSDLVVMDLDPQLGPEKVVWARSPDLEMKNLTNVGFNGDRYYRPLQIVGKLVPYTGSIMAIDPAGRGKDETAYAIVKILNGQLFCLECTGLEGGYSPQTLATLATRAKVNSVNRIIVEANFGDGMFSQLLKPVLGAVYPCTVEEVRHSIQKEKRILDTLEPVMAAHKLVMATRVIENDASFTKDMDLEVSHAHAYQLFYQMSRLTRERGALKHDDRLDALAIAVNYWALQMSRDVDSAMKTYKDEAEAKELQRFMDHALGVDRSKVDTWLDQGLRSKRS